MSVATLGFAIDSSQAVGATKALNGLTAAARPAAAAADQLAASGSKSETVMRAMQAAADRSHVSLATMNNRVATASHGMTGVATSTGLARHELINLSRQIQDVGVSLVSGQSPFMVLAQQGTQIADIFGSSKTGTVGGALKQIAGGIASVLTPMRLLGIGLGAIGIGAVVAANSVAKSSMALDDLARSINTTLPLLHGLEQVAGGRGISSDDFAKGMKLFGDEVFRAQHGMGDLAGLLRANGKSAKDFQGYMQAVADLVGRTTTDQRAQKILMEAGIPPTQEYVRLFRDLAQGIDVATAGTVKFNTEAEKNLIEKAREFDHQWNTATTQVSNYLKSTVVEAIGWFDKLSKTVLTIAAGVGAALAVALAPFSLVAATLAGVAAAVTAATAYVKGDAAAEASGRPRVMITGGTQEKKSTGPEPKTLEERQRELQLMQQRLALLGSTTTAEEAATAIQLQADQARLNGVSVDQKRIDILKQLAREQATGVAQIKASIDSYNIETATIGMSVGAATQYAAVQGTINDHLRTHSELSAASLAAIKAQGQALGDAAAKADLMNAAYSGLVRGPLQTLTSQIANGAKFFDALKSAGISALNAIASKLADMAAQSLWTNALGGLSGGGSSGGLIGGIMSIFKSANGNVFPANDNGISRYSNQIVDRPTVFPFAKGVGLMGEAGPEAIMPLTRGPNGKLGVATSGGGASNTPQNVNINVNVSGARGSQEISDAVNEGVGRALNAYRGSTQHTKDVAMANKKAGTLRLGRG